MSQPLLRVRKESAVNRYQQLSEPARQRFLEALIRQRDYDGLLAIAREFTTEAHSIGCMMVRGCASESVVPLMRRIPKESMCWHGAFWMLWLHPTAPVKAYVRECGHSGGPFHREICYEISMRMKNTDLIDLAYQDLNDDTPLYRINGDTAVGTTTIASVAKRYIAFVNEQIEVALRQHVYP